MRYECFINQGYHSQDIEADSEKDARRQFVEVIRDNLDAEHVTANNLETDDGDDPNPEINR